MPTPTGLPKVGEVWESTRRLPPDWIPHVTRFVVLARSTGSYWSLRVYIPGVGKKLWLDPAYQMSRGELKYIGPAGAAIRKRLGLD